MDIKEEVIKILAQTAVVDKIVEKNIREEVPSMIEEQLQHANYKIKDIIKKIMLELLDDPEIKEKLNKLKKKR